MTRLFLFLFLLSFPILAGKIFLKDGNVGTVEVKDTVGCSVKFLRNGNLVIIKKTLIKKIVNNQDTLDYSNFVCTPEIDSQHSSLAVEEGYNPEKLMSLIDMIIG